ncbi:hypothetical protein [Natrarchaeobius oligotrophus]|uniref:hypothetical protein n=1 Tax=Natrarchaeobius oligotrophus TaxID=3455743 RepID=UPI000F52846B|nr:hypothetical protein [Natrarchaeobius chitinivorans]
MTWLHSGHKYRAPIRPYNLVWVSPASIDRCPVESPEVSPVIPSAVIGGNWDRELRLFQDDVVFRSFEKRFNEGVEWEQTPYYSRMKEWIAKSGSYKGMTNTTELDRRCSNLEKLYTTIKQDGYTPQRRLTKRKIRELDNEPHFPLEQKEITVDVARDGELLWYAGAHRLSIAKILDLKSIPVRIRIRHEKWQQLRDRVYEGTQHDEIPTTNHPDLNPESVKAIRANI